MAEFKVGDKVRVVTTDAYFDPRLRGKIGKVQDIVRTTPPLYYPIVVALAGEAVLAFSADEIEAIGDV